VTTASGMPVAAAGDVFAAGAGATGRGAAGTGCVAAGCAETVETFLETPNFIQVA
jgi:hypothetical protein